MRSFAEAYPQFGQQAAAQIKNNENQPIIIGQQAAAQLPWGHHQVILDKVTGLEARLFYIKRAVENGWSRNVLLHQIATNLIERTGTSINNFQSTLPPSQSDLVQQTIKNPYVFDFLSFSEDVKERELEKALIQHLKKFMLELGKGFAYVGNQKNLVVEDDDFFLDLLFYNYHLHCFVVFELKIGEFIPEYAGKLNFYVNAINAQLKGTEDKPTIGVLLCKTPNDTVIKYSLQGIDAPIGVADYELAKALPAELKTEMPTIEELEHEIEQGYEELKPASQKKLERLKQLVDGLKTPAVKEEQNTANTIRLFDVLVSTLQKGMQEKTAFIIEEWQTVETNFVIDSHGVNSYGQAAEYLKQSKNGQAYEMRIEQLCKGFKKAGVKAFDVWSGIKISLQRYSYTIALTNQSNMVLLEKLYHELPEQEEYTTIIEKWFDDLLANILSMVEQLNKNENKV
jgi:predicted nuclease of restriction endonuclease-like (RecB) superfamily